MATNRLMVNRKLCMGAGECVWSAPRSFALDEENKAIVIDPDGDDHEALTMAMNGCPNFAIRYQRGDA